MQDNEYVFAEYRNIWGIRLYPDKLLKVLRRNYLIFGIRICLCKIIRNFICFQRVPFKLVSVDLSVIFFGIVNFFLSLRSPKPLVCISIGIL